MRRRNLVLSRGLTRVWDPLDYQDEYGLDPSAAAKAAQVDRNKWLVDWRKENPGGKARAWRLTGQLRPYASFGNPDGRVRTVYYVTLED